MTRKERIAGFVRMIESSYAWPLDPKSQESHIAANGTAERVVDFVDRFGENALVTGSALDRLAVKQAEWAGIPAEDRLRDPDEIVDEVIAHVEHFQARTPEGQEGRFVVVEFLTESLGEDRVKVHGPFTAALAEDRAKRWSRATRAMKVVKLDA